MEIDQFQLKIRSSLESYANSLSKDLLKRNTDPNLIPIFKHLPNLFKSGKNLRPYLAWLMINNQKKSKFTDFKDLLMGIELLHVFALVHDDIIDKAETRRGEKTIQKIAIENTDLDYLDLHYGNSQAIIIGDILLSEACYLIKKFDDKHGTLVYESYNNMIRELCYGQMLDVSMSGRKPSKVTEENVFEIMNYKTATYSLYYPLLFGYLATKQKIPKNLYLFAYHIGLAFQAQDDFLDVFGQEKQIGKPVGQDLVEGKHTLLSTKFYQKNKEVAQKFFNHNWKQKIEKKNSNIWKEVLEESKTKQEVEKFISENYDNGLLMAKKIWSKSLSYEYLEKLLLKLKNRTS